MATVAPNVVRVPADHATTRAAIDAARPRKLIFVRGGSYEEMVIWGDAATHDPRAAGASGMVRSTS